MRIQEVTKLVDLTKRAIKLYEEKGLLEVAKDDNGYRCYTEDDVRRLKEISAYRKMGISIEDIRKLLKEHDKTILEKIYQEKQNALDTAQEELEALRAFLEDDDVEKLYAAVNYKSIAKAMEDAVPGFYGSYFMNHFLPYLQIEITTEEQQKAYETVKEFWDDADIRIPLFHKISGYLTYKLTPRKNLKQMTEAMDRKLKMYLNPTEEEYRKLRENTRQSVRLRNSLLFKYHPAYISHRRFMKRMQDSGYNDIFLPAMVRLSPPYKEYHDALTALNQRICDDLGLHYDSDFNLVMKKKENG